MSEEVVHFSPIPCQKFQRNSLSVLLVWNCQLPRDSCGTQLSVAQLFSILHTFASPLSSWSDSWFTIICMSAMIMLFDSSVCVECGLPLLHCKSWVLACPPVLQLTALSCLQSRVNLSHWLILMHQELNGSMLLVTDGCGCCFFSTDAAGMPLVEVTELSVNRSVKTIFVNCTTVHRYNLHTSIEIFKVKLWNKNFFK